MGRHFDEDGDGAADPSSAPPTAGPDDPYALTAGQQDHTNPWRYAGEPAPPPADTGRAPA